MLKNLRWMKLSMAFAIFATSLQLQAKVLFFPDFVVSSSKLSRLGASGIKASRDETGRMLYSLVDDSGAVIRQFTYNRTAAESLREFRPSKIHTLAAYFTQRSGAIAAQKMLHMPTEAFTFFVAIGAVQTQHLIFHYNDNPVAYDQFLTSQTSLAGQVGFGAFMVANGLTAEPLSVIAETRATRFLIPYLGMSAGMLASNITHEAQQIPGLGKCAINLMSVAVNPIQKTMDSVTGKALSQCDEAFEAWMKIDWAEKGHEWAPSLFALTAATLVCWVGDMAVQKVLTVLGVNLALMIAPGAGVSVRLVSWLYQIASMYAVLRYQEKLETPFVFFWKNYFDLGPKLQDSQEKLGDLIGKQMLSNWTNRESQSPLIEELMNFQELMSKWRMANMDTVVQKHGNWVQMLGQLSMEYRVAHKFYFDFVGDLWKKTYETPKDYVHLMDRALPLYGVTPMGFTADDGNRFLAQPNKVLEAQMQTVAYVYNYYFVQNRKKMDEYAKKKLTVVWEDEPQIYSNIVNGLGSKDPNVVGRAIQEMRYRLDIGSVQVSKSSQELHDILEPIYKALGNPVPLMLPGQGYLKLMASDPGTTTYNDDPFPIANMGLVNPTIPEKLVSKMMFGPDAEAGEKTISDTLGFPAHFDPPMIRTQGPATTEAITFDKTVPGETQGSIFAEKVWVQNKGNLGGGTAFDFLRQGGVRASVLGNKDGHKIGEFWAKYPEKELVTAYHDFQARYEGIILELYNSLFYTGKSLVNAGPISNGVLEALETERDVYLYLLDTQLNLALGKPSYRSFDEMPPMEAAKMQLAATQNAWTRAQIQEWQNVRKMLAKLVQKEAAIPGKNNKELVIVSHIATKDFEDQALRLDASAAAYPIDTAGRSKFPNQVRARAIIDFALVGLQNIHHELMNYAQIINVASYVETYEGNALSEPMRPQCLQKDATTSDGCPAYRPGAIYLPK